MTTNTIWHEIKINASPSRVYQALTDVKLLAAWWIPDTRGQSAVGQTLEFRIGEFCQPIEVTSLQPDQHVGWRPTEQGLPDWTGTDIEFALSAQDDRTVVQFRQSKYRDDIPGFGVYSMSWAIRLISLKDLLEKGKGYPFPNDWDQ